VLDSLGAPVVGAREVRVSIRDAADTERFGEDFNLTLEDGYFRVVLGQGSTLLDDAIFDHAPLSVAVFVDGQRLGEAMPLLSMPSAARAERALRVPVESSGITGACADEGRIAYDTALSALRVCASGTWRAIGTKTIVSSGGGRRWSDGSAAASCLDYLTPAAGFLYAGAVGNGTYTIDVDGGGALPEADVECDMSGGGWTVLHHNREARFRSQGCEAERCIGHDLTYTAPLAVVQRALADAASASQYLLKECYGSVITSEGVTYSAWYHPGGMVPGSSWPGGTAQCDLNDNVWRQNGGNITTKSLLPIVRVENGDVTSPEDTCFTIGALRVR
jgi:hypothetical protein